MDRILLALVMIGVIAGCGRRDHDANAPETKATFKEISLFFDKHMAK